MSQAVAQVTDIDQQSTQALRKLDEAKQAPASVAKTPEELAGIVASYALSEEWVHRVRLRVDERWYERLFQDADYDIWVISWLPGQSTGLHDHGGSSGAFIVATGTLEEQCPGQPSRLIRAGERRSFGVAYAHDVRNQSSAPAISIHAYSPPLTEMNEYEVEGSRLVPRKRPSADSGPADPVWRRSPDTPRKPNHALRIDQLLAAARARLRRVTPAEAYEAHANNALLVDIRPQAQRAAEGMIPGALVVERNVLEWRLDPTSDSRLPIATTHDLQVIVFCSEGYTSSLAAAALQDLGLWRAADLVGGFQAWRAAGLPYVSTLSGLLDEPAGT